VKLGFRHLLDNALKDESHVHERHQQSLGRKISNVLASDKKLWDTRKRYGGTREVPEQFVGFDRMNRAIF